MELPEELWIMIKNYIFDYQKYWKNKFNKILKSKILNEIRETSYFNLNNYESVTCIESMHLRFEENNTHYYNDRIFYPNRTEFRLYGWYPFTNSEKKKQKINNIKRIYIMLK